MSHAHLLSPIPPLPLPHVPRTLTSRGLGSSRAHLPSLASRSSGHRWRPTLTFPRPHRFARAPSQNGPRPFPPVPPRPSPITRQSAAPRTPSRPLPPLPQASRPLPQSDGARRPDGRLILPPPPPLSFLPLPLHTATRSGCRAFRPRPSRPVTWPEAWRPLPHPTLRGRLLPRERATAGATTTSRGPRASETATKTTPFPNPTRLRRPPTSPSHRRTAPLFLPLRKTMPSR